MSKMVFDGVVGDLGSKEFIGMTYDKIYVGLNDMGGMKKFIEDEARDKGVEILSMQGDVRSDGKLSVAVKFRSKRGIV